MKVSPATMSQRASADILRLVVGCWFIDFVSNGWLNWKLRFGGLLEVSNTVFRAIFHFFWGGKWAITGDLRPVPQFSPTP